MGIRNIKLLLIPLALSLHLALPAAESLHREDSSAVQSDTLAGEVLTEADVKTMLRDNIDSDKLGVGLVVGIVDEHGTQVISHGKLDNGTSAEVDGDTIFEIGSITKVFTALLLQDMVERGEMKLDDPVQKYLPDSVKMPSFQDKQITLLHLATHTSGLPGGAGNLAPKSWKDPDQADYSVEQSYAFLSQYKPRRAPGIKEEYSNLGMELLGHVIALKAGQDYETLLLERICRPLGMESTRIALTPAMKSRLAIGHAVPGRPVHGMDFPFLPGAGGVHSTANDMLKFISAYLGLTASPTSSLMQKAKAFHSMESGGKLMLAWGGDNSLFAHNGGTYGYTAIHGFQDRNRRGVIVLSNCRNNRIVDYILRPLLDGRSPRPLGIAPIDASIYDGYVGQYEGDKKSNICTVRREGERLVLRWISRSGESYISEEVFPQSESIFRNTFWGVQAKSFPGADGQALKLFVTSLGPYSGFKDPIKLTRISMAVPEVAAPVQLESGIYDRYVGRYRKAFLFWSDPPRPNSQYFSRDG